MMKIFIFVLTMLSVITLTSCENTIHGFGKDLQNAGQQIQSSSNNKN